MFGEVLFSADISRLNDQIQKGQHGLRSTYVDDWSLVDDGMDSMQVVSKVAMTGY